MTTKYGFSVEDWNTTKDEMKQLLIARAKLRGMMPYSELVEKVKTIRLELNPYALAAMLGEISEEEDAAGRGILTVIVVHKEGDMQPGPGFFELAKHRGRNTADILSCWIEELKVVQRVWSSGFNPTQRLVRGDNFRGTIPITRIRQFYDTLRDDPRHEVHKSILSEFNQSNRVTEFSEWLDSSFRHFSTYSNPNEAFHRRTNPDWFSHCKDFAKLFVYRLRPNEGAVHAVSGITPSTIRAVDYEISAYRTTGSASFEDETGRGDSGRGGFDLLAQDIRTGLPIVGEIKAVGDTNMFLDFVQALTFAVELTTASQAERLSSTYNEFHDLKRGKDGCKCDLGLFFLAGSKPLLMEETRAFLDRLSHTSSHFLHNHIRRVAFIAAELPLDEGVYLSCNDAVRFGEE